MSKSISMTMIFKTSAGSINASFTEENVGVVKKVTLPNGDELPYVSGQAMRRYIRDKLEEMGEKLSPVTKVVEKSAASACDPIKYIDDDLFGFMLAGNEILKRISPVKVSPAVAFFPFKDDRDLGVRITDEGKKDPTKLMPPFETEVYYNYFYWTVLIDLARIGNFSTDNFAKRKVPQNLDPAEKRRRLILLLTTIRDLWGGGKQSRFLTDISPKFVIYTRLSTRKPILLERLKMSKEENLDLNSVSEALTDEQEIIEKCTIGAVNEFAGIKVGQQIAIGDKGAKILSISQAFGEIIKDAESASQ
ncbi:MAG: type I-B CRISPR-associated protein Cas7/Cst2/DevR [Thaumarchaeota archaeon]|nr:type I-B CRISPR-associated protein Cas7/Cst2/DevR [Nitrososphaerota archaeon]